MLTQLWLQFDHMLRRELRRERGQGMVEYALIIALVAVVVVTALLVLGPRIKTIFDGINGNL